MRKSISWKIAKDFHIGVMNGLCPDGTYQRRLYDLCLKRCRILVNEGPQSLWSQYSERKRIKNLQIIQYKIDENKKVTIGFQDENGQSKIIFPKYNSYEKVSIIIPVYNNAIYTYNCLKSISEKTKEPFEIIVVDDASDDETKSILESMNNIKIIRNESNKGFIISCNEGAKSSEGNCLLFLNNDTIVTDDWLRALLDLMKNDGVGAVGAKLVYPNGTLQEAGGIVWNDAFGWNYGRGDNPEKPEYNFVREVDYCSGAVLLVRKDLFEKIGGFDERFRPAYYEDTDLCFSIRNWGYRVLYQPESVVIHYEGKTSGTEINSGAKGYQLVNRPKFLEKWNDVLTKAHFENGSRNLFLARSRKPGKNILVIDRYVPTPDRDAGSYRMHNLLKIMVDLGHNVTFIGDNLAKFEYYTKTLQQLGVEVIYEPFIGSIEGYLRENGKFFDIVILSRAHIAIKHFHAARRLCNKAKIIFDTVDLQFLREQRRAAIENNKMVLKEAKKLKKLELTMAALSDVTLVVSPIEKDILRKENPSLRVEMISLIHEVKEIRNPFSARKDIMFLGGFEHTPNVDAVKWFVQEIFPYVKKNIPDLKFYVVGNEPTQEIKSLASEDIIITGYVESVAPYFENCRVSISPLRYGAGVKGKINQSMSYGLPVVTTSIGAEGIGLIDGTNALIADDPEKFADKILSLYNNIELWNEISRNSIDNIKKNFSYEASKERIQCLIENISKVRA